MSGSFDKKGGGGEGKRPGPTIEGTATEVAVEPDSQQPESQQPESQELREPGQDEPAGVDAADTEPEPTEPPSVSASSDGADRPGAEAADTPDKHETHIGPAPVRRSFGAALWAGLVSIFSHALAGVIGALAVLIAIAWGYLPLGAFKDAAGVGQIEDRIAKLEAVPATPDNTAALEALRSRLEAVENKPAEIPEGVTALAARVTQLETSLTSMAEAAKDGGSVADAAAVSQQISAAEQRLDAKMQAEIKSALAKAETGGDAKATKAIDDLKSEVAALDAKLKALTEAKLGADDAGQLGPEITALDERLGRIESTLPALVEAADQETAETKKATLAIALANLREAVSEGRPYASELSTLAVLSPGALDLGRLLDYEDTGIPTIATLTASFETLKDEVLAAQPGARDGSFVGRLLGSAESLVKIKRVDEGAEGASPDAVLARASAKLNKGDLEAAVKDVESLQGPAEAVFASWLDEAKARLDAPSILRRLQNILLVSLGGSETGSAKKTEPQE